MKSVSSELQALVAGSHRRYVTVTAHTIAGASKVITDLVDGQVSFRLSQAIGNRSGTVRLPVIDRDGYSWLPQDEDSFVGVFGQYVTVTVNYVFPDGTSDPVHLGEFPIVGVEVERPAGFIKLTLGDWAVRLEKNLFDRTRKIATSADTLGDAVDYWASKCLPVTPLTITGSGANNSVTKREVSAGTSVWSALTDLCRDRNSSITVTGRNSIELVDDPWKAPTDQSSGIVADLKTGPGGTVRNLVTTMDLTGMSNRVVVIYNGRESYVGSDGKTKYRDKTYYATEELTTGPFAYSRTGAGIHEVVETVPRTSGGQAQADYRARWIANRRLGVARGIEVETVPMPWLECGDLVRVYGFGEGGEWEAARIESITVPFLPDGASTITMRTYMNNLGAVPMAARSADGPTWFGADR